jgi:hypothetical protein
MFAGRSVHQAILCVFTETHQKHGSEARMRDARRGQLGKNARGGTRFNRRCRGGLSHESKSSH